MDSTCTESRLLNYPRRWNGAPSQELLVIRENHKTNERSLHLLRWGPIPHWCEDPGGRKPINAKSETVARLPTFRDAYHKRRCILPVDGFYEWRVTKHGETTLRDRHEGPLSLRNRGVMGDLGKTPPRGNGCGLSSC